MAKTLKDNKNVVTPFAFSVAHSLLGTPLASPWKRVTAITIDLCIIVCLNINILFWLIFITWLVIYRITRNHLEDIPFLIKLWSNKIARATAFCVFSVLLLYNYNSGDNFKLSSMLMTPGISELSREIGDSIPTLESRPNLMHTATPWTPIKDKELVNQLHQPFEDFENSEQMLVKAPPVKEEKTESLTFSSEFFLKLGSSFGWSALYFTILTAWYNGQTIGKKIVGIKVTLLNNQTPNLWESFNRYGGYTAGLATGSLGFIQIYWDANRQSIQDKIAETLVIKS